MALSEKPFVSSATVTVALVIVSLYALRALQTAAIAQLQEQMAMMAENQQAMLDKLGAGAPPSGNGNAPTPAGVNNGALAVVPTP